MSRNILRSTLLCAALLTSATAAAKVEVIRSCTLIPLMRVYAINFVEAGGAPVPASAQRLQHAPRVQVGEPSA